jgi:hypothetical protein
MVFICKKKKICVEIAMNDDQTTLYLVMNDKKKMRLNSIISFYRFDHLVVLALGSGNYK